VATAVTKGDLGRSIQVAARGEVAELKDNVNQMIRNLKETTDRNREQDWLKTNLARLNRLLQGQRDMMAVSRLLLSELAPLVGAQHAVLYLMQPPAQADGPGAQPCLTLMASYGYQERKTLSKRWHIGEGIVGQAAFEKQRLLIASLPEDYIQVVSGLGQAAPRNLVVLPILFEGQVKAVIELAAFEPFQAIHLNFLDQLAAGLGIVFNSIESAAGTETLLRQQAQKLEGEFQFQQAELQKSNAELERKAHQLAEQNVEVARKNQEIEEGRKSLQEKAEQLTLTSKYKSEFLANMSHELRSPLNSLLLLAEQLRQNRDQNLTDKQLEMIKVMHASGRDLLHLINDILDLSKIEAGGANLDITDVSLSSLANELDKSFRYQFEAKGLAFTVDFAPDLPSTVRTDGQRVKQLLTNLLSNALKFTSKGSVSLTARVARSGWNPDHPVLSQAPMVLAFSVSDTGIGIPANKKKLIFEAFQQADASTSRRYGGTGLGLAIGREIARLLDGELAVESEEGVGSTFSFYLPHNPPASRVPPYRSSDRDVGVTHAGANAGVSEGTGLGTRATPDTDAEASPSRGAIGGTSSGTSNAASSTTISDSSSAASGGIRSGSSGISSTGIGSTATDEGTSSSALRAGGAPPNPLLLIIEDDPVFARTLQDMAHERGFDTLVTPSGQDGLRLARHERPQAIMLDLELPDVDGWDVADRLKEDGQTREIPVHVISIRDRPKRGAHHGVASYTSKPTDLATLAQVFANVTAHVRTPLHVLLLIENDLDKRNAIKTALAGPGRAFDAVSTGAEALAALRGMQYQGMVIDLDLPDLDGLALLSSIRAEPALGAIPAVLYSERPVGPDVHERARALDAAVVGEGSRPLDHQTGEVAAFLQRVKQSMPAPVSRGPAPVLPAAAAPRVDVPMPEGLLKGKCALIVDDDARNLFALTGLLESYGLDVVSVGSGKEALRQLEAHPGIDIVLMDIMMPDMDGYEVTRRIRADPRFAKLPIIALTAKAMLEDRSKCLAAGASDYASKPVDTGQLLAQLRVWLGTPPP
jgi:signal transduction histidine kinase/DNA-binding response OmpR family regulator